MFITINISDNCPICGAKRGTPKNYHFCEDGDWFDVDTWENPCGHKDMYKDVYLESLKNIKEK